MNYPLIKIPQEIGKNESGVFLSEHGKLIMLTSEVESILYHGPGYKQTVTGQVLRFLLFLHGHIHLSKLLIL